MPSDALVTTTLPCTSCGYNLRTLPRDSRCTECGQEVATSLAETIVQGGVPEVHRLADAAKFAGVLNVVAIGMTFCMILLLMFMGLLNVRSNPSCFVVFYLSACTLIAFLHVIAAARATAPMSFRRPRLLRPLILTSGIVFCLATLSPLILAIDVMVEDGQSESLLKFLMAWWTVLLPSLPVFVMASGFHFAMLCKNGGIHSLVGWHHWCSRGFAAGAAAVYMFFFVMTCFYVLEFRHEPPEWTMMALVALYVGGLIAAGIALVATTILLFRTSMRLRQLAAAMMEPPIEIASTPDDGTASADRKASD